MPENRENQFGLKAIIQLLSKIKSSLNNENGGQEESVVDKEDSIISLLTQMNNKMKTIVTCTQEEYDAIDPKDPATIYLIVPDDNP